MDKKTLDRIESRDRRTALEEIEGCILNLAAEVNRIAALEHGNSLRTTVLLGNILDTAQTLSVQHTLLAECLEEDDHREHGDHAQDRIDARADMDRDTLDDA